MSLYIRTKKCPNHSPRLLRFMKSNPSRRIIAIGKEGESLKSLQKRPINEMNINFTFEGDFKGPGPHKIKSISGRHLHSILVAYGRGDRTLLLMSERWAIDITDRFIEKYSAVGPCAFSDSYHKFKMMSQKVQVCRFCGVKEKKVVVWSRSEEWERVK